MVVELEPAPTRKGCIIIPDPDKTPLRIGKVIAIGPGRTYPNDKVFHKTEVEVGERVAFPMAATQVGTSKNLTPQLADDTCMIRETDVFFTVEGDVNVEV
jgi:co-chaperonin GroES (HSP10)